VPITSSWLFSGISPPLFTINDQLSTNRPLPPRLISLDAFRGAVMLLMASSGLGIPEVARHFPESSVW